MRNCTILAATLFNTRICALFTRVWCSNLTWHLSILFCFLSLFSHNAITSKVAHFSFYLHGIAKNLHASMNLEEFEISIFGHCFLSWRSVGSTRPKTLSLLYCLYCTAFTTGCNNIMLNNRCSTILLEPVFINIATTSS